MIVAPFWQVRIANFNSSRQRPDTSQLNSSRQSLESSRTDIVQDSLLSIGCRIGCTSCSIISSRLFVPARNVSSLLFPTRLISSRHVPSCRWQSLLPWRDSPKDCRRPNLSSSWNCSFMSFFEEFFFFVPKILFCVREEGFIVGRLSSILGCSHFTLPSSWQFSQQEEGKERKSGEEGQRSNSQDS